MGIKKMSLANIQGKLSRAEMKNIMAGSGGSKYCDTTAQCVQWYGANCACLTQIHQCGCVS